MSLTLAILAGDRYRDAFLVDKTNKGLLAFEGRTCLERILAAVDRSPSFGAIVVVGPQALDEAIEASKCTKPVTRVDQGDSLIDNMRRAFVASDVDDSEQLFLTTVDIPLVRSEELERFVKLVKQSSANAIVSFARGDWPTQHGGLAKPYQTSMILARGGPYLMGNMFAGTRAVLKCAEVLERARNLRKQSKVSNIVRAFPTLLSFGINAGPALVVWLRLTVARRLWLRHRDYDRIPRIAPRLDQLSRSVTTLVAHKVHVGIVDIGGEGACFDLDDQDQYEAMQRLFATG